MPVRPPAEPLAGSRPILWRTLVTVLYLAAGAALYAYLLRRTSMATLGRTLVRADLMALAASIALGLSATGLRAARFASLLKGRGKPVELYGSFAVMRLLRFAMPFQSGEILAMLLLKRRGLAPSLAELAPAWMLIRIGDIAAIGLLLTLTLALVSLEAPVRWLGASFLAVALLLGLALLTAGRWVPALGRRSPVRSRWLQDRIERFMAGLQQVREPRTLARTLGWSFAVWGVMIATVLAAQVAFHAPLSLGRNVASATAMLAVSLVPIHAPLGLGTQDAAWSGILMAAGMPADAAVPLALSARLLLVGIVLLDGLLGFLLLGALSPRRS